MGHRRGRQRRLVAHRRAAGRSSRTRRAARSGTGYEGGAVAFLVAILAGRETSDFLRDRGRRLRAVPVRGRRMTARVLVALVLMLAGCGGAEQDAAQSKSDYERAVRAAVAEAREAGGTPAALRAAGERLRDLEPPAEVAGPHRDLVASFDAVAGRRAHGRRGRPAPGRAAGVRRAPLRHRRLRPARGLVARAAGPGELRHRRERARPRFDPCRGQFRVGVGMRRQLGIELPPPAEPAPSMPQFAVHEPTRGARRSQAIRPTTRARGRPRAAAARRAASGRRRRPRPRRAARGARRPRAAPATGSRRGAGTAA